MNHCSKCLLITSEVLPIMQSTGIGICIDCYEKMDDEEIKQAVLNLQQGYFKI